MFKKDTPLTKEEIQKLQGKYSYIVTFICFFTIASIMFEFGILVHIGIIAISLVISMYCVFQINTLEKKSKDIYR